MGLHHPKRVQLTHAQGGVRQDAQAPPAELFPRPCRLTRGHPSPGALSGSGDVPEVVTLPGTGDGDLWSTTGPTVLTQEES